MHEKSIELLNKAVADELAAVHQYMYFHFHLEDQGYAQLSTMFERTGIHEMGHVEVLAERIIFLGGDVVMKTAFDTKPVQDVSEMLDMARKMEEESAMDYNRWANESAANSDSVTKKIFEQLVADEEMHFDQFDTELMKIKKFGERYLALQSMPTEQGAAGEAG
jgi:bacterioferritin